MTKTKKPLIIVAHASVGSGHMFAAKAISNAIKELTKSGDLPANMLAPKVELIDILDYFKTKIDGNKTVSITTGFMSSVYDYSWRKNFTGRVLWAGGNLWPSFLYKKFEDYIKDKQPDAVVCTHFVCANAAAKARISMDKYFPIISVPTDYETEGLWPSKETDLFCVACQEMKDTLIQRNVASKNIKVTGIPVSSKVNKSPDKKRIYKKFKIPEDKQVAIILAGSTESGPYKHMRKTLNECIKMFGEMDWLHFVFCVGKDGDYAKKLINKIKKFDCKNISVVSYTNDLVHLIRISDIALIKPGGLIVTECADIGLPVLLVGKTYGQESINRRYLIDNNAAMHATTYKGVVNYLCEITTDKKLYRNLKKNIRKISHKNSAKQIAKDALLISNKNLSIEKKKHMSIYIGKKPTHTW